MESKSLLKFLPIGPISNPAGQNKAGNKEYGL